MGSSARIAGRAEAMERLATFIRKHMAAREMTIRELSFRLGYSGNSFVSNVLNQKKMLPIQKVDEWAKALGLKDADLEKYYELCSVELAPKFLQRAIQHLRKKNAELESLLHNRKKG
jgi:hypothetical protein